MIRTDSSAVMTPERTLSVYSVSNGLCTRGAHALCTFGRMADPTAEYVFALAAQRGWSQVEFAEKVSQTKQSVTNWRSRGIPPKHHAKVARVFGITVEELLAAGKAAKGPRESLKQIFGVELTAEAAHFAAEWMALRSPLRAQVQAIIQTLVQEQARDARNASVDVREPLRRSQGS